MNTTNEKKNETKNTSPDTVSNVVAVKASEKDYRIFCEEGLPLFTWILGLFFGFLFLRNPGRGGDIFAMQEEEVNAIAPPLSAYLAKQHLPTRVKKIIVSSNDAIGLIAGFGMYFQRVAGELTSIRNSEVNNGKRTQANSGQAHGQVASGSNGHGGESRVTDAIGSIPLVNPAYNQPSSY